MSNTPRTDAATFDITINGDAWIERVPYQDGSGDYTEPDFARQLELELKAVRKERDEIRQELDKLARRNRELIKSIPERDALKQQLAAAQAERDEALAWKAQAVAAYGNWSSAALDNVALASAITERDSLKQQLTEAHAKGFDEGATTCMSIRCMKHRAVPQLNQCEASGAECPICAMEDLQANTQRLRDVLEKVAKFENDYPTYSKEFRAEINAAIDSAAQADKERLKELIYGWRSEADLLDSGGHPRRQGLPRKQILQESCALRGCAADLEGSISAAQADTEMWKDHSGTLETQANKVIAAAQADKDQLEALKQIENASTEWFEQKRKDRAARKDQT